MRNRFQWILGSLILGAFKFLGDCPLSLCLGYLAVSTHSRFMWLLVVYSFFFYYCIYQFAQNWGAMQELEGFELFADFRRFFVTTITLPDDLRDAADKVRGLKRKWFKYVRHTFWQKDHVVAFVAKPLDGSILGQAKAYPNPFGTSAIVLDSDVAPTSDHSRFVLFHEFEHTMFEPELVQRNVHVSRLTNLSSLVLFTMWSHVWWQWIIMFLFAFNVWFAWYSPKAFAEAFVDNSALWRLKNSSNLKTIAGDLVRVCQLQARPGSTFESQLMAFGRGHFAKEALRSIELTGKPRIMLANAPPHMFVALLWSLVFLLWPVSLPVAPSALFLGMALFMVWNSLCVHRANVRFNAFDELVSKLLHRAKANAPKTGAEL